MAIELTADQRPRQRATQQQLVRWTLLPAWITVVAVAFLHLLGLSIPVPARYGVLLVTLLVVGLPHGAADHVSLARALNVDLSLRFLAGFCSAYLALAAAYTVVWFLAPGVAFLAFLALTWVHWGQGDLYTMSTMTGDGHRQTPLVRALTVVVRGGLPMLVPLLFFPDRYGSVARTVVGLFDSGATEWFTPLFSTDVRLGLGIAFGAVTVLTLVLCLRGAASRRTWFVDAGEMLGLWVFFAVVPPVLAIGVYFAVWHSLRHVSRLIELDAAALAAVDRGAVFQAVGRFGRDALPGTVGALALFGGLALAVPATPATVADIGGVYLVLLAVLTLPHVVVVSWLDLKQGIWGD